MSTTRLLRRVTAVHPNETGAVLDVVALTAVTHGRMPGWLTGEPLAQQGIETELPNLPSLSLPDTRPAAFQVRLDAVAPDTVRLVVAPTGHAALHRDGTWLGIVTEPRPRHVTMTTEDDPDHFALHTGPVTVTVTKHPFSLRVRDALTGRDVLRTAERLRQVAGLPLAPAVHADSDGITLNAEISPGEAILGFGEQFGQMVKNGQRLRLRAADALGTGTGMAYKPVPMWHSTLGVTGLVNTGTSMSADIGHSRPSVLALSVPDDALDIYLVVGSNPRKRLTSYTALTGRGYVPGLWAFGYWMGRCRYHSADEMLTVAQTMRDNDIPCDVLHCDPDWLIVDRLNTDFIWNERRFGERAAFIERLRSHGMRLSLWELPYLDPLSPRYGEAREHHYLVVDTDGEPVGIESTHTPDGRPRGLLNFFDEAARRWWQGLHDDFLADGVAVFKTDFGEGLPDTAAVGVFPSRHAHNLYPLWYNGAVSTHVRQATDGDSLVWGRSGWAGSQRYPAQWGGDAESTVVGMQSTLRGGLSYAMSAPGLWSHDIGGFFGPELTPELYIRWTQFGAMSPLMRAHGLRPREPWHFGAKALAICRDWNRLRYSLLPYLWQVAHEVARDGLPMLRPLHLEFPDDPVCLSIDDQYLLGHDLMVVPIFSDSAAPVRRRYYVPEGRWTDLVTGDRIAGPGYRHEDVPLERQPVLVRSGAVLPRIRLDGPLRNTDELRDREWTIHAYHVAAGHRELVGFDRTRFTVDLADPVVVHHD